MSESNKVGRPETVLTDEQIIQIEALAAYLTVEQIADYLCIAKPTFYEILKRDPRVFERYNRGVAKACGFVGSRLMRYIYNKQDSSLNLDATKFYLRNKAGWSDKQELNVTTKDVTPKPMKAVVNFSKPPETANLTHDQVDKALDES